MLSAATISSRMISQLRLLDPAFSLEVGTTERKIIDTVAEFVAGSQVDYSVLLNQHDLDTMTGGRLDAYLGNFGWGRQTPRAATGRVTFSRSSTSDQILIPRGTQLLGVVDNDAFPNLTFVTTETVIMGTDSTSVDAPVRCTTYGTIGNLSANSITSFVSSVSGITSVTNSQPTTNGRDGETDAEYKLRFQNSIFRNQSGTYDHILALALSAPTVTKANVVGPISRYVELIQVPSITDTGDNEVQTISVPGSVTAFTIRVNDEVGREIAHADITSNPNTTDAAELAIVAPLNEALNDAIGTVAEDYLDISTTGAGPYVHAITFKNSLGRRNLAPMTIPSNTGGTVTVSAGTDGAKPTGIDDIQSTADGSFGYDSHDGTPTDPHNWPFKLTTLPSTIPYSKFTYPDNHFLTDSTLSPASAYFYRPGVDYIFNDVPINADSGEDCIDTHAYSVGDVVKGSGATGKGRVFVCVEEGTSQTSTPTWNSSSYLAETWVGDPETAPKFVYIGLSTGSVFPASTAVTANTTLVQDGDDLFLCSTSGTTAATPPTWDVSGIGATTVSNTAQFKYLGKSAHSPISAVYPNQPNVTILVDQATSGEPVWPTGISSGSILLLEHQYMSQNSRNDYSLGILNAIDVYVNGGEETSVDSAEIISGTSHNLQFTDPSHWTFQNIDPLNGAIVINFERGLDGRACNPGNRITPLLWQPVLSLPDSITIGQNKYLLGNYYLDSGEAFRTSSAYLVGEAVQSGTSVFICVTAGTSGSSAPSWDTTTPTGDAAVSGWPKKPLTTSGSAVFAYFGETDETTAYFNERTGSGTEASPYLYTRPAHYTFARNVNANAGSIRSKSGIEWLIAAPIGNAGLVGISTDVNGVETYTGAIVTGEDNEGHQFDVSGYTFDQNIQYLQSLEDSNKQVAGDILVHRAQRRYFKVYITVMYEIGATEAIVNAGIDAALAVFYENQYYGAALQLSDIIQAIHDVPGVDNVRWTADRRYDTVPDRENTTAYTIGDLVRPTTANGFVYEAKVSGTTGGSEPTSWPEVEGETVTDGSVVWAAVTEVRVEEVNIQGTALESGSRYYTNDFFIEDRELAAAPLQGASVVVKRAQQTWGA